MAGAGGALLAAGAGAAGWRASTGSMAAYEAYAAGLRDVSALGDLLGVIRYATLAANSHNTQPWRFKLEDGAVVIGPDLSRRTPAVDPDDHHLFVSLGCAGANLALAAAAGGRPGELSLAPEGAGLRYDFVAGAPEPSPLAAAISQRQSTRAAFDGRAIPAADLAVLESAAALPGVSLALLVDRPSIGRVRDLVLAGNEAQMDDPAFMRELKQWLRFNPRAAMTRGDGLFSASSGNPVLPTALGSLAFDQVFTAASENRKYARQIGSSSGIAIFVGERADPDHWMRVGRSCQRFALAATGLGLKLAFINQPVEVAHLRGDLAALIGDRRRPDIVMRFGYGPSLPYSPRRPVTSVIA